MIKALMLIASLSLMYDVEAIGTIDTYQQKDITLTIDSGKSGVEVLTDKHDISCKFSYVGKELAAQYHTDHCFLKINADLPAHVVISVTNNEPNPVVYRARAYSMMDLK